MYKLTNSIDGVKRATVNVQVRLTLEDMAIYVAAMIGYDVTDYGSREVSDQAVFEHTKTKGMVMHQVRQCVVQYGTEIPFYKVGDDNLTDVYEAVLKRLQVLWD